MARIDDPFPEPVPVSKKKSFFLFLLLLVTVFFLSGMDRFFSLDYLRAGQERISQAYQAEPCQTTFVYFAIYVTLTALSLPGAAILTLAGGAIFGLLAGIVIVSFASSLGATLAFLASRFLFRETVQKRFNRHLDMINRGIRQDGAFYLFTLRLVPTFPFFLINLLMGLTPIRTRTFYWVSQIGMLAGTIVYVNAGTQIAKIESVSGILSWPLILSFLLLGGFPWLARAVIGLLKKRSLLGCYPKPKIFDYNLVVIGAGSAGLVTAYLAAALKARVALVERERMGGDCLYTGCVPSKALLSSARFVNQVNRAREFGIRSAQAEFDFGDVMDRIQQVIRQIEPHDSVERYTELGAHCIRGEARISSPYTVEVNGKILSTRNIVIATGASPSIPAIQGLEGIDFLTSDTVWNLQTLPERLLVLGGGPIGCELAQAFARLGSHVTLVERDGTVLAREDFDVSGIVMDRLKREGVDLRLEHKPLRFLRKGGKGVLVCELQKNEAREVFFEFNKVLIAVGRVANTKGFGLEDLGIPVAENGVVKTNEYLQTIYPNIYACGDVAGPYQLTHTAAHQAWYAAVNALFGGFRRFKVDYSMIPWAILTEPEVARVGLNERDAEKKGIPFEVTRFPMQDLDRAIADGENEGVVKVLTVPGRDRILGVSIVGHRAGDMIAEYVLAMRNRIGLSRILNTIHVYPTFAEANKHAAGNWKRAHTPAGILRWLGRFHNWRRS